MLFRNCLLNCMNKICKFTIKSRRFLLERNMKFLSQHFVHLADSKGDSPGVMKENCTIANAISLENKLFQCFLQINLSRFMIKMPGGVTVGMNFRMAEKWTLIDHFWIS